MIEQVFPHKISIYRVPKGTGENELIVESPCNAQSVNTSSDYTKSQYKVIMPMIDEAELNKGRSKLSANLEINGVELGSADVIWLKNTYISEIEGLKIGCSLIIRFTSQPFI